MIKDGKVDILWRGQCGGWVLEFPNGQIEDYHAYEASEKYIEFYGGWDDPPYDLSDGDTCEHGVRLDRECKPCSERFMAQQFAALRLEEGLTADEVITALSAMVGLAEIIDVHDDVRDVVEHLETYLMGPM